jgi:glutaredoxin 3
MPEVTVYTTDFCGYCTQVMTLLARRGIPFREVSVADHPHLRDQLLAKSGRRTLPQVYVGERYIGGAADVAALDRKDELTGLLQARNDDG